MIRVSDISDTGWIVLGALCLTLATIAFFWLVVGQRTPSEDHASIPTIYINNERAR